MNASMARKLETGPAARSPVHFLVGRNSRGLWVARERERRRGGLFRSCAAALRFVYRENNDNQISHEVVAQVIELFDQAYQGEIDTSGNSPANEHRDDELSQ